MTPDTALTAILNDEPVPEIWLDGLVHKNYNTFWIKQYKEQPDIFRGWDNHAFDYPIDANFLWPIIEMDFEDFRILKIKSYKIPDKYRAIGYGKQCRY